MIYATPSHVRMVPPVALYQIETMSACVDLLIMGQNASIRLMLVMVIPVLTMALVKLWKLADLGKNNFLTI